MRFKILEEQQNCKNCFYLSKGTNLLKSEYSCSNPPIVDRLIEKRGSSAIENINILNCTDGWTRGK